MYDALLVPVDGSGPSDRAVDHATELARQYDARLYLLTAVEKIYTTDATTILTHNLIRTFEKGSEEIIEAARERVPEDVDVETEIRDSLPAEAIEAFTSETDVDVVVMGTHGQSGLSRLFLGSTTERTVRLVDCPVLAVHPES